MNRFAVTIHYKGAIDPGAIVKIREIDPSDLIILATSREGGISYNAMLDILPRKLSKTFSQNNLVFIYPETANTNAISNYEEEVTGGMIQKGVEIIKTAGKIFRRKG